MSELSAALHGQLLLPENLGDLFDLGLDLRRHGGGLARQKSFAREGSESAEKNLVTIWRLRFSSRRRTSSFRQRASPRSSSSRREVALLSESGHGPAACQADRERMCKLPIGTAGLLVYRAVRASSCKRHAVR